MTNIDYHPGAYLALLQATQAVATSPGGDLVELATRRSWDETGPAADQHGGSAQALAQAEESVTNVSKIQLLLDEVWDQGKLDVADDILAPDIVNHDKPPGAGDGLEEFKHHVLDLRGASSEFHVEVEYVFGADEWVMARFRWQGLQDGPIFGIPPSGRRIDVPQHSVWRFHEGKATDFWYCWDETRFLIQIGVIPERDTNPLLRILFIAASTVRMGARQFRWKRRQKKRDRASRLPSTGLAVAPTRSGARTS
jgi:predicted ester cyclase